MDILEDREIKALRYASSTLVGMDSLRYKDLVKAFRAKGISVKRLSNKLQIFMQVLEEVNSQAIVWEGFTPTIQSLFMNLISLVPKQLNKDNFCSIVWDVEFLLPADMSGFQKNDVYSLIGQGLIHGMVLFHFTEKGKELARWVIQNNPKMKE